MAFHSFGYPQVMALLLLILLLLGVIAIGAYALMPTVRAMPIHLGWAGLFLIFLAELIRAWPK